MLIREIVEIREDQILNEFDWKKLRNALIGGALSLAVLGSPGQAIEKALDSDKITANQAVELIQKSVASGEITAAELQSLGVQMQSKNKMGQLVTDPKIGPIVLGNMTGYKVDNETKKNFSFVSPAKGPETRIYINDKNHPYHNAWQAWYAAGGHGDPNIRHLKTNDLQFAAWYFNTPEYKKIAEPFSMRNYDGYDLDKKADTSKVDKKADTSKVDKKADTSKVDKKADTSKVDKKAEPEKQSPEEVERMVNNVIEGGEKFAEIIAKGNIINGARIKVQGQKLVLSDKTLADGKGNGYINWKITGVEKNTRRTIAGTLVIQLKNYKIVKLKWTDIFNDSTSGSYTYGDGDMDIRSYR